MSIVHVISMSGGKDSTATALIAREECDPLYRSFVFADTGNEHQITYDYLDYLQGAMGITIIRLRVSFAEQIAGKRAYVAEHWARKGVPDAAIERALKALVPTGNPFLDLCLWKGRFPSRMAQFCTQELKTKPLVEYQMALCDQGFAVWSWQGIRADEGGRRRFAASFEEVGGGLYINRPILRYTAQDTFTTMAYMGIKPNPLYTMGFGRVGCMPCINCGKNEIREMSERFPEQVDRLVELEAAVAAASKRGDSSFFINPDRDEHLNKRGIRNMVQWAKTTRGGQQFDLLASGESKTCSSSYGLCE